MPPIFRTGTAARWSWPCCLGCSRSAAKFTLDGGYQGGKSQAAVKRVINQVNVKIVKRADAVKGFLVLPKRWAVERTLAWLNRCRRLAKHWECNRRARGFLLLASVRLRVRRLGRNTK